MNYRRSRLLLRDTLLAASLFAVPLATYYAVRYAAGRHEPYRVVIPPREFRISAKQLGRYVELTWDPHSSVLGRAHHAHLFVDDGGRNSQVWLNDDQLSRGSYLYSPTARRLQFRLEVYSILNGQDVGAEFDNSQQNEGRKQVLHRHRRRRSVSARKEPDTTTKVAEAATAITLNAPGQAQTQAARPDVQNPPPLMSDLRDDSAGSERGRINLRDLYPRGYEDSPEAATTAAPLPPSAPAPEPAGGAVGDAHVNHLRWDVRTQPVPPSVFRSAVQKVPGLRLLQKGRYKAGPGFVPARPLTEPRPVLPQGAVLQAGLPVSILAKIDERGSVVDARYQSNDPAVGQAAAVAVRGTAFEPARLNNTPVASEVILRLTPRSVGREATP